jgi:hypothetical protein
MKNVPTVGFDGFTGARRAMSWTAGKRVIRAAQSGDESVGHE